MIWYDVTSSYQWEVKYQARNEGGWYDIDEKKRDQKWNAMLMDICYWSILYALLLCIMHQYNRNKTKWIV